MSDSPTPPAANELLPCPFCGGTNLRYRSVTTKGWGVFCEDCLARAGHAPTKPPAIENWNRRALPAAADAPAAPADREAVPCEWQEDSDGNYTTGCGHVFFFDTGGPTENSQKFCGYCGKALKETQYVEPDLPEHEPDAAPVLTRATAGGAGFMPDMLAVSTPPLSETATPESVIARLRAIAVEPNITVESMRDALQQASVIWRERFAQLQQERDQSREERDAAIADAKRYNWLRESPMRDGHALVTIEFLDWNEDGPTDTWYQAWGKELDAAIDQQLARAVPGAGAQDGGK